MTTAPLHPFGLSHGRTWVSPGEVARIVDGDTVHVNVDLGYLVAGQFTFRLHGLNAPEHNTVAGKAATAFLKGLIPVGTPVTVTCTGPDKYGARWQGILVMADGTNVNDALIASGNAAPWDGNGPKPVPVPAPVPVPSP